jgi:ATP-dependent exoDNAse (exonuclease V) beta subunit
MITTFEIARTRPPTTATTPVASLTPVKASLTPVASLTPSASLTKKPIPDYLAKKNAHPRDPYIEFDEGPHIYTVHGKGGYTSVTTWIHSHFSHFDADAIIDKMIRNGKTKDPTNKYYGMTKDEIKTIWSKNGAQASGSGTELHYDVECFYNQVPVTNNSIEYQFFQRFVADFPDLKPYRTEWMVYYEEYLLSGSIDMLFENPDGTLQIYDWKRSKEIKYDDYGKHAKTPCIRHIPDANFWHYSIQLNLYKTILEHKYGKTVTALYLVIIHPDNPSKTYDRLKVDFMDKEIADLLEYRKAQLEAIPK